MILAWISWTQFGTPMGVVVGFTSGPRIWRINHGLCLCVWSTMVYAGWPTQSWLSRQKVWAFHSVSHFSLASLEKLKSWRISYSRTIPYLLVVKLEIVSARSWSWKLRPMVRKVLATGFYPDYPRWTNMIDLQIWSNMIKCILEPKFVFLSWNHLYLFSGSIITKEVVYKYSEWL